MEHIIEILDTQLTRYEINPNGGILGRQWDNNADSMIVSFPQSEIDNNTKCYIIITRGFNTIENAEITNNVPFPISDKISQYKKIKIGFSFQKSGYIKNSEIAEFEFLEAPNPNKLVTSDSEQIRRYNQLYDDAFTDFEVTPNKIIFYNSKGEVLKEQFIEFKSVTKTSELENDGDGTSPFVTQTVADLLNYYLKSETYSKSEVNNLVNAVSSISMKIVDTLPEAGESNIIYLVPAETPNTNNIYNEFIYIYDSIWEQIGSTQIDLSDYVKKTDYAQNDVGGIVKIRDTGDYGIQQNANHQLYIRKASDDIILTKTSSFNPIVPSNLDIAIKYGLSRNSLTLTEEEKANAQNWLGISSSNLNAGIEEQVDYNAVLQGNEIIASMDESVGDFAFTQNASYLFHIYLPLVTLTGELNDNYLLYLTDKNGNRIHLNCMYEKDITKTSTVGDFCQIQDYDVGIGYSWEFNGHYREINDGGIVRRVVYVDTITRETNPSMTGRNLHDAITNSKLKVGNTVYCSEDYAYNGYSYISDHTYKIIGDWVDSELILDVIDLTASAGSSIKTLTYDDTTLAEHITEILGHINSENGGSLLSVGFKVGANSISATAKNIQFNSDGTTTITYATVTPFTQGDFVNCTLKHINDSKTGAYFNCGINQISNATLEIFKDGDTTRVLLSNNQLTSNAGNGSPLLTFYNNIDISNMQLEHLTITYHI